MTALDLTVELGNAIAVASLIGGIAMVSLVATATGVAWLLDRALTVAGWLR